MEENGKYLGQAKQKLNSKNYMHQNILKKQRMQIPQTTQGEK